jgi:hypothetical protein
MQIYNNIFARQQTRASIFDARRAAFNRVDLLELESVLRIDRNESSLLDERLSLCDRQKLAIQTPRDLVRYFEDLGKRPQWHFDCTRFANAGYQAKPWTHQLKPNAVLRDEESMTASPKCRRWHAELWN